MDIFEDPETIQETGFGGTPVEPISSVQQPLEPTITVDSSIDFNDIASTSGLPSNEVEEIYRRNRNEIRTKEDLIKLIDKGDSGAIAFPNPPLEPSANQRNALKIVDLLGGVLKDNRYQNSFEIGSDGHLYDTAKDGTRYRFTKNGGNELLKFPIAKESGASRRPTVTQMYDMTGMKGVEYAQRVSNKYEPKIFKPLVTLTTEGENIEMEEFRVADRIVNDQDETPFTDKPGFVKRVVSGIKKWFIGDKIDYRALSQDEETLFEETTPLLEEIDTSENDPALAQLETNAERRVRLEDEHETEAGARWSR
jgi:hypothetical protein